MKANADAEPRDPPVAHGDTPETFAALRPIRTAIVSGGVAFGLSACGGGGDETDHVAAATQGAGVVVTEGGRA